MGVRSCWIGREYEGAERSVASTDEHPPLAIHRADDVLVEAFKPYPKMQDTP